MLYASFNSANTWEIVALCDASLSTHLTAMEAALLMLSTLKSPIKFSSKISKEPACRYGLA